MHPPTPPYLRALNDSPPPPAKGNSLLFKVCLPWKPPFGGKKQLCCHGNTPFSSSIRCVYFPGHFVWACLLATRTVWVFNNTKPKLNCQHMEHKCCKITWPVKKRWCRVKFNGISAHYISARSTEGLEFNTIWHNTLTCGALKVCRIPRCSAPDERTHVSALPVWKKPRKAGKFCSPLWRAQPCLPLHSLSFLSMFCVFCGVTWLFCLLGLVFCDSVAVQKAGREQENF